MDSEVVKERIASGEYEIVENPNPKATSDVWKRFGVLRDEENNIVVGYAACKTCKKPLKYESQKIGTSTLKKHECRPMAHGARSIDQYFRKKGNELLTPETKDKDYITELCTEFASLDIR